MSKSLTSEPSKRRNVYFRNPAIFQAFQLAIETGIIRARGASERLEELIAADLRKHAPKLRKARQEIPMEVFTK